MKYITSCPQCDTHFLLNDELIKAYRGKVQCGNCEHIFNAKNRLTEVADDVTSAEAYQASLEEPLSQETEQEADNVESKPIEAETHEPPAEVDYHIPPSVAESQAATIEAPIKAQEPATEIDHFLTKKNHANQKPKKYAFLIGFIQFLLILALILQSIYFLRGEIAARFPQTKPLLERACIPLKCTIDLKKNLDLITIGDSDMQEDDTYQSVINFSSSLQNNAKYPQAYPSIELTLTDNSDQPVIKKLITPTDYLTSKKKVQNGLASHEIANVKLALYVDEPSVASYRILLLY